MKRYLPSGCIKNPVRDRDGAWQGGCLLSVSRSHGDAMWMDINELKLEKCMLDEGHCLFVGNIPESLRLTSDDFDRLWNLHPEHYHEVKIHGRHVKTPRWQQAYGADYHYTGRVNEALPVPDIIQPLHAWCRANIDERLNGLLLNWYDGSLGHYIGKHRDSTTNMCDGAPIVTISFGESRVFRLRPWKGKTKRDFPATDGSIFLMPYATNLVWTHEVPKSAKCKSRRISVTLRAFDS